MCAVLYVCSLTMAYAVDFTNSLNNTEQASIAPMRLFYTEALVDWNTCISHVFVSQILRL